jgi:hypothetical protein
MHHHHTREGGVSMSKDFERAIQSALDGELTEYNSSLLNQTLGSDSNALETYCGQMHMHALLSWRSGILDSKSRGKDERKGSSFATKSHIWSWSGWAAAALLILGFVFFSVMPSPATAAAALDIMRKAAQAGDRTYSISVVKGDSKIAMKNGHAFTYEGAKLHLRGERQFVLVLPISEGGERITGSDGIVNWDIVGHGPVKQTNDLARFRSALPGEQQDAIFLDLTSSLNQLSSDYDLSLVNIADDQAQARLVARKKSTNIPGPRVMEFTYRRNSGVIVELILQGLPRAKGGPEALRLTLTSEAPLPEKFFTHHAHHEPSRSIRDESPSPQN